MFVQNERQGLHGRAVWIAKLSPAFGIHGHMLKQSTIESHEVPTQNVLASDNKQWQQIQVVFDPHGSWGMWAFAGEKESMFIFWAMHSCRRRLLEWCHENRKSIRIYSACLYFSQIYDSQHKLIPHISDMFYVCFKKEIQIDIWEHTSASVKRYSTPLEVPSFPTDQLICDTLFVITMDKYQ